MIKEEYKTLEELLDEIQVHYPGMWENKATTQLYDWYAVSTPTESIIAYFQNETDAFSFRLHLINQIINTYDTNR